MWWKMTPQKLSEEQAPLFDGYYKWWDIVICRVSETTNEARYYEVTSVRLHFLNSLSCQQKHIPKSTLEAFLKELQNYNSNLRYDLAQWKTEFALQEHEELLPASATNHYLQSDYLGEIENKI